MGVIDDSTPVTDLIPGLAAENVKIRNVEELKVKLQALRNGGLNQLQVITDYDLTITKHHVNGQMTHSSFGLLTLCTSLPADFMIKNRALKAKYFPIEFNPLLSRDEKFPHMEQWYGECDRMFDGIILKDGEIEDVIKQTTPQLRDGSLALFRELEAHKVPVLVLSAGLGDVIKATLASHGINESDYFHIVSNFFKMDNGIIRGFGNHENGQFIHPFNKNGLGCADYFKCHDGKSNVILMGDSIGDANMDDGVPQVSNVLKIGFLYGPETHVEQSLPKFIENFDIVLIDDQTMNIPQGIINYITV